MTDINEAIKILQQGGIGVFPTDTAFGIGCRFDNEESVRRLYKIRRRPITQAVSVLVDSLRMAQNYLMSPLPNNVRHLMKNYWPGGLTIVYRCREDKIPKLVRAGGSTLGVRMPKSTLTLKLITGLGVPLLGPSANFHGKSTPYESDQLDQKLLKVVDFVLEGKCRDKLASTVVDCTSTPWKILRQGVVRLDNINAI